MITGEPCRDTKEGYWVGISCLCLGVRCANCQLLRCRRLFETFARGLVGRVILRGFVFMIFFLGVLSGKY